MATKTALRMAMVGLRHGHVGSFGPEPTGYVATLSQLEDVQVVAYCEDTEPRRFDQAHEYNPGARLYSSVDDLIAQEDFDLAWVVLPSNEIPPVGIKLAEAGKHFYMEKQFARRAADLAELVSAVHRNGVKVLPAYPWRFHPVAQDLKRLIDEGKLGRPFSIESRQVTTQVGPGGRDPGHFIYTDREEGGGILHMLGGHFLELMRFLMGCEVKAVQAMVGRPVGHIEEPLEDVAIVALEYENGAFGSMHAGYLQPGPGSAKDSCLVYRGLEGWADWAPIGEPRLDVKSVAPSWSGAPERTFSYNVVPYSGYMGDRFFLNWIQGFIHDIQAHRTPSLTVDDALCVLETIDAAYESARTGRLVEVKSLASAPISAAAS